MDSNAQSMSPSSSGKRVLLVEDDQFLRDLYVELLKGESFAVDQAADGQVALEMMTNGGYDLVLLDVMLPKKDGIQIVSELKNQPPKLPNKTIVFLTNMAQDSLLEKTKEYGVAGYLVKSSLTPDQFLTEVKKYLGL